MRVGACAVEVVRHSRGFHQTPEPVASQGLVVVFVVEHIHGMGPGLEQPKRHHASPVVDVDEACPQGVTAVDR